MDRKVIKAICVGWLFGGATAIATQVLHIDVLAALVLIMLMGSASTLYVLNS